MTLSGATSLDLSGPGGYADEGVHLIPHSFNVTGASPIDLLVSYPGHSLVGLVYSTIQTDRDYKY